MIIADRPLDEIVPLCKDKDDNVLTQFEGWHSERCGLLKSEKEGRKAFYGITEPHLANIMACIEGALRRRLIFSQEYIVLSRYFNQ